MNLTEIKIVFVNGKIRLLRKVENPSVPFLNLLSLTITWNTKQFPRRRCDRRISKLSEQRNLDIVGTLQLLQKKYSFVHRVDSFFRIAIEISVTQAQAFFDKYGIRLVNMTREEFKERVSKLIQTLENVERSLQFTNIPSKKKQTLTSQKTKKIMAKKEIKKQTIEEILAEHTPTSDAVKSAVQRYNEEKKKQQEQIIINTLGAIDCIIWDLVDNLRKIRAEEKRAQQCIVDVAAAKDAYLADPDLEVLAQGLRKAGISLSHYIE